MLEDEYNCWFKNRMIQLFYPSIFVAKPYSNNDLIAAQALLA